MTASIGLLGLGEQPLVGSRWGRPATAMPGRDGGCRSSCRSRILVVDACRSRFWRFGRPWRRASPFHDVGAGEALLGPCATRGWCRSRHWSSRCCRCQVLGRQPAASSVQTRASDQLQRLARGQELDPTGEQHHRVDAPSRGPELSARPQSRPSPPGGRVAGVSSSSWTPRNVARLAVVARCLDTPGRPRRTPHRRRLRGRRRGRVLHRDGCARSDWVRGARSIGRTTHHG